MVWCQLCVNSSRSSNSFGRIQNKQNKKQRSPFCLFLITFQTNKVKSKYHVQKYEHINDSHYSLHKEEKGTYKHEEICFLSAQCFGLPNTSHQRLHRRRSRKDLVRWRWNGRHRKQLRQNHCILGQHVFRRLLSWTWSPNSRGPEEANNPPLLRYRYSPRRTRISMAKPRRRYSEDPTMLYGLLQGQRSRGLPSRTPRRRRSYEYLSRGRLVLPLPRTKTKEKTFFLGPKMRETSNTSLEYHDAIAADEIPFTDWKSCLNAINKGQTILLIN